jgi:TolB-like protein/DNA-binding winged helix-turn-helix (wHTH) protein/Flp pilus assembly protein TadD
MVHVEAPAERNPHHPAFPGGGEPRLRFADFELNAATFELFHSGRRVELKPQPARLLAYLVLRAGVGVSRAELAAHLWPGRHVEVDQGLNSCIRQIRNALGDEAGEPRFVETLPRFGYRFVAPVVAVTSAGVRRRRWLAVPAFGVVLALALTGTVCLLTPCGRGRPTPAAEDGLRLVVLPFRDAGTGGDLEHVALGLTEELIAAFAASEGLEVIALTSALRLADGQTPLPEIADALGVDYAIEGSVLGDGRRMRVHVRLVDARTQATVWSRRYERAARDELEIQASVASAVLAALPEPGRWGERGAVTPPVPRARRLYLEARYHDRRGPTGGKAAEPLYRAAVEADPGYAPAWTGLAHSRMQLQDFEGARQAVALDEGQVDPHLVLANVALVVDWDWDAAGEHHRAALRAAPGSSAPPQFHSFLLSTLGRHREALAEIGRAVDLDPVSPVAQADFGLVHYWARDYAAAARRCRQTLALEPDDAAARSCLLYSLLALGRRAEAAAEARHLMEVGGAGVGVLPGADLAPDAVLERYWTWNIGQWQEAGLEYGSVIANLGLGRLQQALRHLEAALEGREWFLVTLGQDPRFDPLRGDPRFVAVMDAVGIPPAARVGPSPRQRPEGSRAAMISEAGSGG